MNIIHALVAYFKKLAYQERSPHILAFSFSMGTYIAFSPFPGLHTLMIFLFTVLFGLNLTVTFAAAYAINNPLTLVPVYAADYGLGYWLLYKVASFDMSQINPLWMQTCSAYVEQKLGFPLPCFWSFIVGGNILGVLMAIVLYPITKAVFTHCKRSEPGTSS